MIELEELETLIQNRLDYVNSIKNSSSGFQIAGHGALTELMSSALTLINHHTEHIKSLEERINKLENP